jgi:tRNA pseudouridine55 synthase
MNNIHGWLNINKNLSITSMKAVSIIKRILKPSKIGHAGTLDPLASGVLPMAIGAATKLIEFCMDSTKIYKFTVKMGQTTNTLDSEGEIIDSTLYIPSQKDLENACVKFTGVISQIPPNFSALKVNGVRAYKLARESDVEFQIAARNIHIHKLELTNYNKEKASQEMLELWNSLDSDLKEIISYIKGDRENLIKYFQ